VKWDLKQLVNRILHAKPATETQALVEYTRVTRGYDVRRRKDTKAPHSKAKRRARNKIASASRARNRRAA